MLSVSVLTLASWEAVYAGCDLILVTVTVTVNFVSESEYQVSVPLAPSSPPLGGLERRQETQREDRVLPLGSSILSPGLRLRLAG